MTEEETKSLRILELETQLRAKQTEMEQKIEVMREKLGVAQGRIDELLAEATRGDNTLPKDARMCEECFNLVTTDATCPLCAKPTAPHPDASTKEEYCIRCAKGPFPAETMHLVTWNENPYSTDDGDLMCVCPKCRVEET